MTYIFMMRQPCLDDDGHRSALVGRIICAARIAIEGTDVAQLGVLCHRDLHTINHILLLEV